MATGKRKNNHGGRRANAGRKKDSGMKKTICVTVDESAWVKATEIWPDKKSRLVNHLLSEYLSNVA